MQVKPKSGVLLIRKHSKTARKVDITIQEADDDKRLITGTVLATEYNGANYGQGSPDMVEKYPVGTTVIFGKYAIYNLTIKGENFYLIEEEDIVGTTDYTEDV